MTGHRVGDALTIARQITDEGERDVQIEDEKGQVWGVEGLAGGYVKSFQPNGLEAGYPDLDLSHLVLPKP